jgi:transcriptional regulator with XRE-family HTH domain
MGQPQKIFFPENIRFLRGRKNLSQENLAQQLGMTRVKLNAIESGKTKNPALEDLVKFSGFFRISIDSLLRAQLSRLLELQLRDLEAGNDVYMMGTKFRVLPITLDKDGQQNCEYVPVKAQMGYRSGYNDPQYIASLPKYNIPSLPRHGTYRTFQAEGDSMFPIPDKAEITGEYIENWLEIKPDTPCIVVLNDTSDFVFKLVTFHEEDRFFLLRSLNSAYEPYTVPADEVLEIWRFKKLHLDEIPEPAAEGPDWKRMFSELKQEIRNLKK